MGYRSEVGFACDPIVKEIIETVSEWNSDLRQLLDDADDQTKLLLFRLQWFLQYF